jgi:hypothetical protein
MKKLLTFLFVAASMQIFSQDFRKANWGETQDVVKTNETATLNATKSTSDMLFYESALGDKKVEVVYKFAENKLVRAKYNLLETYTDNNTYYSDYLHFKALLTKKYGPPDSYEQKWFNDTYKHDIGYIGQALSSGHVFILETWNQDKTEISHALYSEKKKILHAIEYVSTKYGHLEKEAEKKSEIEDL